MAKSDYPAASAASRKKRILLVDDHPVVRNALTIVLHRESDLEVIGSAEDVGPALDFIHQHKPDLVVVDLLLRESSGYDLIRGIRATAPDTKILCLSALDEVRSAARCLREGANGYLMKTHDLTDIVTAVRAILDDGIYLSAKLQDQLLRGFISQPRGANLLRDIPEILSPRELQVFELIGEGYRAREIAERLGISEKTVGSFMEHIRTKLDLDPGDLRRIAIGWCRDHGSDSSRSADDLNMDGAMA